MTLENAATGKAVTIPWWVRLIVVLGAVLTTVGAIIALVPPAMLVSPHDEINGAVRIYAGYLAARNLAIALMLACLLLVGAKRPLSHLMVLIALIQVLDACIDALEGRWMVVPGVLLFCVIFLIGAARLSEGSPFWKTETWMR
jgi:hypothetical protein